MTIILKLPITFDDQSVSDNRPYEERIGWNDPDWQSIDRIHDWRNHVSDQVRTMWHTFTDTQKQALQRQADDLANAEHWD